MTKYVKTQSVGEGGANFHWIVTECLFGDYIKSFSFKIGEWPGRYPGTGALCEATFPLLEIAHVKVLGPERVQTFPGKESNRKLLT